MFDMSAERVVALLGNPNAFRRDRSGNEVLSYGAKTLTFDERGLAEIGFSPEARPNVAGIDILGSSDAFKALVAADGDPRETLGFVVFLKLGISVTGIHDKDESQLAATAFRFGRWDPLKQSLKPLVGWS